MDKITATLTAVGQIGATMSVIGQLSASLEPSAGGGEPYRGAYEFTPSSDAQTIEIAGMRATADIIINPVPNNYGLITWNGSVITVS